MVYKADENLKDQFCLFTNNQKPKYGEKINMIISIKRLCQTLLWAYWNIAEKNMAL